MRCVPGTPTCAAVAAALVAGLLPVGGLSQTAEPLARWAYYKEIQLPSGGSGLFDLVLDLPTLNKSRDDHADLRLYDAAGREVPYTLRILRDERTSSVFEVREFNRGVRQGATEVSYDLGSEATEHNEVEIHSAGESFRRRVEVEGSADGKQWSTLVGDAFIFRLGAAHGKVAEDRVSYPPSRYQFLRVRVHQDPQADREPPQVTAGSVRKAVQVPGETLAFWAALEDREATRESGRAASAYRLDAGGRVPVHGLQLTIIDEEFSRPFQLEAIGGGQESPRLLASGHLARQKTRDPQDRIISFPEKFAARLELTVTDDRNAPLTILAAVVQSAARQVVFEIDTAEAGPLKLYYGNPQASAPHYDFADSLPRQIPDPPRRLVLGVEHLNPAYEPEPEPLSERSPWLIYLVLGLASLTLFFVLRKLARSVTADRET